MVTMILTHDDLNQIERAAQAATIDTWQVGHTDTQNIDETVARLAEAVQNHDTPDLWVVFVGDPDDNPITVPAITGNGPTSQANAEYLEMAQPRNVLLLAATIRHLMGDRESVTIPWPAAIPLPMRGA